MERGERYLHIEQIPNYGLTRVEPNYSFFIFNFTFYVGGFRGCLN